MHLSVIVVNWKSAVHLHACLGSLYRFLDGDGFETIVVDNASGDGCAAMLAREFPQVRLVAAPENLGFARANNLGFTHSCGDILLFLNPDTEVCDTSLERMAAWLRTHPQVGAVGARLLNSDGSLQQTSVQAFPTLRNQFLDCDLLRRCFPRSRLWGTRALWELPRGPFAVDAICGACFMMRRDVFKAVGRFSEEYFMYADDLDLSYKIRQAGYSVVCLTDCAVTHHGGRSAAQQGAWFTAIAQRNAMAQFFYRTRGPVSAGAYRMLTAVAAVLRLGLTGAALALAGKGRHREQMLMSWSKWSTLLQWSFSKTAHGQAVESASHA